MITPTRVTLTEPATTPRPILMSATPVDALLLKSADKTANPMFISRRVPPVADNIFANSDSW